MEGAGLIVDGFEFDDCASSSRSFSLGSLRVMIFFRFDFDGALAGVADGAGEAVAGVSGLSIVQVGLLTTVC